MNSKTIAIIFLAILLNFIVTVVSVDPETESDDVCPKTEQELGFLVSNGTQRREGECVEVFMGAIPDFDHMVASKIRFPRNNEVLKVGEKFTILVKVLNLLTGFFSDPVLQYYSFPQTLDKKGFIQGHSHVVIQRIEDEDEPLDPRKFDFFQGLNFEAINDVLNATVEKGLEKPGDYRLCTMTSSFSHQPVLMPVAQRGAQDDCVFFKVVDYEKKKRGIPSSRKSKLIKRKSLVN